MSIKIKKLPKGIKELALEEQFNQRLFYNKNVKLDDAFTWGMTRQGYDFWYEIDKGNYKVYYVKYGYGVEPLPKQESNDDKLIRRFPTELWDNEIVVNDNGLKYIKRDGVRVFETGSVRSLNDGRERYDLIPQLALDVAAKIFGKNIGQFGSGNHMEYCIPEKACLESLKRHLAAYTRSLEGYDDTNEDDAGSILTNALMLVHTIEMKKIGLYKIKYGKDL